MLNKTPKLTKLLALSALPILIACNDIDVQSKASLPENKPSETQIDTKLKETYQDVSEHLGIDYAHIITICHTNYTDAIATDTAYNLTCHWDPTTEDFSIHYSEFDEQNEANARGEFSTIKLTVNRSLIEDNLVGIDAMLYYPTGSKINDVENLNFDITDDSTSWKNALSYSFDFEAISSDSSSVIKSTNGSTTNGVHIYNLIDSELKRFRISSDVELANNQKMIKDEIVNDVLFSNIHNAIGYL